MKSRARIVLAISFALLSTGSIVTCVTMGDRKPPSPPLSKLKEFSTNFNETINEAIRSPDATTFASQKCDATFLDHRIQKVASGDPVCRFQRSEAKMLRTKVNDWIDTFFPERVFRRDGRVSDPLPGCTIDSTWFLMKVDTTVVPDGDGSVSQPDAGDGG